MKICITRVVCACRYTHTPRKVAQELFQGRLTQDVQRRITQSFTVHFVAAMPELDGQGHCHHFSRLPLRLRGHYTRVKKGRNKEGKKG